jgi:CubicO group peptidase (beta-lactamase class C family)
MRTLFSRITLLSVLLLLFLRLVSAADATDEYVARWMKEFHVPGLAVAVIKDGTIVKAEGYGVANRETRDPATIDTVFKIGSVSKQFIATGIMLLVRDGRLRLDDPVSRYLADAPVTWRPITIRRLLSHTAGLARESPLFDGSKRVPDIDIIRAAYPLPLLSPPGEKYAYSNLGYWVLAEITTRTSGRPWAEYLRERVFERADLQPIALTITPGIPNRATGYGGNDNGEIASEWVAVRPSGAFVTTVRQLIKWDAVLQTDRVLTAAERQQMITGVPLNNGSRAPYGFGWHVEQFNNHRYIWHGGGLPGFSSNFARFPDDHVTIIALSNGDDSDIGSLIANLALIHVPGARATR